MDNQAKVFCKNLCEVHKFLNIPSINNLGFQNNASTIQYNY